MMSAIRQNWIAIPMQSTQGPSVHGMYCDSTISVIGSVQNTHAPTGSERSERSEPLTATHLAM